MKVLSIVAAVIALALPATTSRAQAQPKMCPVQVMQPCASDGKWAAIAISTSPAKDAFGFQYDKDLSAGAEADARRSCEERFAQKGIRGASCNVKSTTDYVAGLYCLDRGQVGPGIGVGVDPAEAADQALQEAGNFPATRCTFQKMRHGSRDKREIDGGSWNASLECRGRTYRGQGIGAVDALNRALRGSNSRSVAECRVVELNG